LQVFYCLQVAEEKQLSAEYAVVVKR
jgi:hypothetical protein